MASAEGALLLDTFELNPRLHAAVHQVTVRSFTASEWGTEWALDAA